MNKDEANRSRDRELGMRRAITRRDFLNGIAVGQVTVAVSAQNHKGDLSDSVSL
jgi:hypothetical protein